MTENMAVGLLLTWGLVAFWLDYLGRPSPIHDEHGLKTGTHVPEE